MKKTEILMGQIEKCDSKGMQEKINNEINV
jgi:hypothetical protein